MSRILTDYRVFAVRETKMDEKALGGVGWWKWPWEPSTNILECHREDIEPVVTNVSSWFGRGVGVALLQGHIEDGS